MSPYERLIDDATAERFEREASSLLSCSPLLPPETEAMAAALLLLLRDRAARLELAVRPQEGFVVNSKRTVQQEPWCILTALSEHRGPMTARDLAKITGQTPKTIYASVAKGEWPVLKVGSGAIRFDPATVAAWLCERNPTLKRVRRELRQEDAA